jgi:cephalosporin hydroxylase
MDFRYWKRSYRIVAYVPQLVRLWLKLYSDSPKSLARFALSNPAIRPLQVQSEFEKFLEHLAILRPATVLEIGTWRGGTLLPICRLSDDKATIISLDLPGGTFGGGSSPMHLSTMKRFKKQDQQLHFIRDDSHKQEVLERVQSILKGRQLDLLFLDGDHTYSGVRQDFEMYAPLVRKGGTVALHDIVEHSPASGCRVSNFWNELKLIHFQNREIIEDTKQEWAGIGLISIA